MYINSVNSYDSIDIIVDVIEEQQNPTTAQNISMNI